MLESDIVHLADEHRGSRFPRTNAMTSEATLNRTSEREPLKSGLTNEATTCKFLLNFHGVGAPHAEITEAEQPFWIATNTFAQWIQNSKFMEREFRISIVPSFDDGNISDLDIVAPVLAENNMPGLFFPCVGRIAQKQYLGDAQILTLARMGHEIGSHGVHHVPWTLLDAKALNWEIRYSKDYLENLLNTTIESVAVPFGAYNRRVLSTLRKAKYTRIYTTDRGLTDGAALLLNRYSVRKEDDPRHLRKILQRLNSRPFKVFSRLKTVIKSML